MLEFLDTNAKRPKPIGSRLVVLHANLRQIYLNGTEYIQRMRL